MANNSSDHSKLKKHPKDFIPLRSLLAPGNHLPELEKLRPALYARLENVLNQEDNAASPSSEQRLSVLAEKNMLRAAIDWMDNRRKE